MKLDTTALRYLTAEDWRVLTAVEQGSRNHELVPTPLITQISGLRSGSGIQRSISTLAKANLIARVKNAKYDGYRLTYGGLDYLSLHTHLKKSFLYSLGTRIGVGKESDVFICASPSGVQRILKVHRLGRISFRTVKTNRDYLRHRSSGSWMYMSRLAALKEFTFMQKLWENGFPIPEPVGQNRHTIVMALVDGVPLRQVKEVGDPKGLYAELIELVMSLARHGLVHGDFNEFNVMVIEKPEENPEEEGAAKPQGEQRSEPNPSYQKRPRKVIPILIDFPQTVSIDHPNADMYFDRDVACIKSFFKRKFHFTPDEPGPFFKDARKEVGKRGAKRLDVEAEASGFSRKMAKELDKYMEEVGARGDGGGEGGKDDDGEEEDGNEESEDSEVDELGEDRREEEIDDELTERDADEAAFRAKLAERKRGVSIGVDALSLHDET